MMIATILPATRFGIILALDGGLTTVIFVVFMIKPPKDIWGAMSHPRPLLSMEGAPL